MSLGPPIPKPSPPAPPEWVPVPGRPHLWRNAAGQFKYMPPLKY
jgi:hypothetical protein